MDQISTPIRWTHPHGPATLPVRHAGQPAPAPGGAVALLLGGPLTPPADQNGKIPADATPPVHASRDLAVRVLLHVEGACALLQQGKERALAPNDVVILLARSHSSALREGPDTRVLMVDVPWDLLQRRTSSTRFQGPCVLVNDTGIARVIGSLIRSIHREIAVLAQRDQAALRDGIIEILATALKTMSDHAEPQTCLIQHHCNVVKAYIEDHLQDPYLEPSRVAAAHRISARHLHRLFASAGGSFGKWVRTRRLDRCRMDLESPRMSRLSITEIAFRWGFNDASHFSRLFKSAYGLAPRDYRTAAIEGDGVIPHPAAVSRGELRLVVTQ